MKITIYRSGDVSPVETWDNYPVVPNVGDRITIKGNVLSWKVEYRVFSKDAIKLIIKN